MTCMVCNISKTAREFYGSGAGYMLVCKVCHSARVANRRKWQTMQGKCIYCKEGIAVDGKKACHVCAAKDRSRMSKRRQNLIPARGRITEERRYNTGEKHDGLRKIAGIKALVRSAGHSLADR